MSRLLLDGSKIEAEEFYRLYDKYVGMPHEEWENLPTTIKYADEETYEYRDDKFAMGGTAYSAPKLYLLTKSKKQYEKISIALSPDILKKLEEGQYNKSKLIDSLLTKYFAAEEEKAKGEASTEKK